MRDNRNKIILKCMVFFFQYLSIILFMNHKESSPYIKYGRYLITQGSDNQDFIIFYNVLWHITFVINKYISIIQLKKIN